MKKYKSYPEHMLISFNGRRGCINKKLKDHLCEIKSKYIKFYISYGPEVKIKIKPLPRKEKHALKLSLWGSSVIQIVSGEIQVIFKKFGIENPIFLMEPFEKGCFIGHLIEKI